MVGHTANLLSRVVMKYGGSNMANKWQKRCFSKNFNHELWAIGRSFQNSATAVRNYICRATFWAIVLIYPPMLQWNMADPVWPINGKNGVFLKFNHELWAIGRSCQSSVSAVRNCMCRATWWAIVPVYPPMLQWNMADPIWLVNGKKQCFVEF